MRRRRGVRRGCPRRGVMESARKTIAVWLALACCIHSMLPCQCRWAASGCTSACCPGEHAEADGAVCPVHQCTHSHEADCESSRLAIVSVTTNDNVPEKSPAGPTCPRCEGKFWLVLSKSFDRDETQQISLQAILVWHPWQTQWESRSESVRPVTDRPTLTTHLQQLCRMQV